MRRGQIVTEYATVLIIAAGIVLGVAAAFYSLGIIDPDPTARCQGTQPFRCDDDSIRLSAAEDALELTTTSQQRTTVSVQSSTLQGPETTHPCEVNGTLYRRGEAIPHQCETQDLVPGETYEFTVEDEYFTTRHGPKFTSRSETSVTAQATQGLLDSAWTPQPFITDKLADYADLLSAENVHAANGPLITTSNGTLYKKTGSQPERLGNHGFIADLTTQANRVYLASQDGLVYYKDTGSLTYQNATTDGSSPRSIDVKGSKAYYVDDDNGITVYKKEGQSYDEQNTYTPGVLTHVLKRHDNRDAAVAGTEEGIRTYSANGFKLTYQANASTTAPVTSLALRGDYAYTVVADNHVAVFSIAELTTPSTVSYYQDTVIPRAVSRDGDTLAVAGTGGVELVDTSDPASLQTTAYYPLEGTCTDVDLTADKVYTAGCGSGYVVLNR